METRENPARQRFELLDDGTLAGFIDVKVSDGRYWLTHTELEPDYRGSGVGSLLVRGTLDDLRARGAIIVPTCPFIGGWLRRHPEYQDLVDQPKLREFKRSRGAARRRTRPPAEEDAASASVPCTHVPSDYSTIPEPWPIEGCAECIAAGRRDWVRLRVCQSCGHVGCCDSSPGRHGTGHFDETGHALIRPYEVGADWWYCYVDVVTFDVSGSPPAASAPA